MSKLIRDRDGDFTHVKNDIFESELSAKAMGIFMYMWHLPNDWQFYTSELTNHFKEGRDAIRSGLKELEEAGFLKRIQPHIKGVGKFDKYDWKLIESPQTDYPSPVKPSPANPTLLSTKSTKYEDNKDVSRGDTHKSVKQQQVEQQEQDVLNYLNNTIHSDRYKSSKDLRGRLEEGYTPTQLKQVVYYCAITQNWLDSTNSDGVPMVTYLRPKTLFKKNKCREYLTDARALNDAQKAKQQQQLSATSNDVDKRSLYS